MDKEEAKMIVMAYFDEKEERDRIVKEKEAIEKEKKKKEGAKKELVIGIVLVAGLYLIWRALGPIINMVN